MWDLDKGFATHNFKGHGGVVNLVKFHPDAHRLHLVTASEDSTIMVWDLATSKCVAKLEGHMSTPTAVAFSEDGFTMASTGRDKVINIWNLRNYSLLRSHPVYEMIEGMVALSADLGFEAANRGSIMVATAGEKGVIKSWSLEYSNYSNQKLKPEIRVAQISVAKEDGAMKQLSGLFKCSSSSRLVTVTNDNNIIFVDPSSLARVRQIV